MGNGWTLWMVEHGKKVLMGVGLLFVLLFIGFQLMGRSERPTDSDYLTAHETCEQLFTTANPTPELLNQALAALKKNPDLEGKVGGKVAQRFIDVHESQNAVALSERGLKRIQELAPAHVRFAKNSLMISKGDYAHALMEAKELKIKLQQKTEERSSLLYHFNLLRIAFLEMRLGNPQEEFAGWQELIQEGKRDPREWALLLSCFQKEDLSLLDFIQARLKVLSTFGLRTDARA